MEKAQIEHEGTWIEGSEAQAGSTKWELLQQELPVGIMTGPSIVTPAVKLTPLPPQTECGCGSPRLATDAGSSAADTTSRRPIRSKMR